MRSLTAAKIVQDLRRHAPTTRGAVSARTGISPALVGRVVEDLVGRGLVADSPEVRKQKTLTFSPLGPLFLGVEVHRHLLRYQTLDLRGNGGDLLEIPNPFDAHYLGDGKSLGRHLEKILKATGPLAAIAVAVPHVVSLAGAVHFRNVKADQAPPGAPWFEAPLGAKLTAQLGVPVTFVNRVNALAMGQWRHLTTRGNEGIQSFMLVSCGTSLGGAFVFGGGLHLGSQGFAGEIGQARCGDHGIANDRGQCDTLENTLSNKGLLRRIRHLLYQGMESRWRGAFLSEMFPGDSRFIELLLEAWEEKDPVVTLAAETAATHLGRGLAALDEVFDPGHIFLTGTALFHGALFDRVARAHLEELTHRNYRQAAHLHFLPSEKGDALFGAVQEAQENYLAGWTRDQYGRV